MIRVLLSGAGGSAAANFLDALRRSGEDYHVVGTDTSPVHLHLSRANDHWLVPRADDAAYPDAMRKIVEQAKIQFVHPQPDPEVLAIGEIRETLGALTYLPTQYSIVLSTDKERFATLMRLKNISVPETAPISKSKTIADAAADLLMRHERVWVRARVGAGARASLPVSRPDQAVAWVTWWAEERGLAPGDFMVAEFLPGREFAYQSVWQDGQLVAGQARERVEYLYGHLTPHGQTSTPSVARTVRTPYVDEVAVAAIRALDPNPQGAYCVDLKQDASGRPKVTEINVGRFFTTSNFFAAAGLNMPHILVQCALGEKPPRLPSSPLPPDLYWIRMVDMGYTLVTGEELEKWTSPIQ